MSRASELRNRGEYGGASDIDERILKDLIVACRAVAAKIEALPPIP